MPTIFTRIINGEIPCHKVAEDDRCFAFLDIRPVVFGHVLVVPKQEIDYIFDVPDELLQHMMLFSKQVAKVLQQEVECVRIGVMVAGLEVPHAHIHLIPINSISEMSFTNPRPTFDNDKLAELAERLLLRFSYQ